MTSLSSTHSLLCPCSQKKKKFVSYNDQLNFYSLSIVPQLADLKPHQQVTVGTHRAGAATQKHC